MYGASSAAVIGSRAWWEGLKFTASSVRSSTKAGYRASATITATTGTITSPSAVDISRDSAPGASVLCIER